jgi:hypothetical protein
MVAQKLRLVGCSLAYSFRKRCLIPLFSSNSTQAGIQIRDSASILFFPQYLFQFQWSSPTWEVRVLLRCESGEMMGRFTPCLASPASLHEGMSREAFEPRKGVISPPAPCDASHSTLFMPPKSVLSSSANKPEQPKHGEGRGGGFGELLSTTAQQQQTSCGS